MTPLGTAAADRTGRRPGARRRSRFTAVALARDTGGTAGINFFGTPEPGVPRIGG